MYVKVIEFQLSINLYDDSLVGSEEVGRGMGSGWTEVGGGFYRRG